MQNKSSQLTVLANDKEKYYRASLHIFFFFVNSHVGMDVNMSNIYWQLHKVEATDNVGVRFHDLMGE